MRRLESKDVFTSRWATILGINVQVMIVLSVIYEIVDLCFSFLIMYLFVYLFVLSVSFTHFKKEDTVGLYKYIQRQMCNLQ